jgi:hypothetical protein
VLLAFSTLPLILDIQENDTNKVKFIVETVLQYGQTGLITLAHPMRAVLNFIRANGFNEALTVPRLELLKLKGASWNFRIDGDFNFQSAYVPPHFSELGFANRRFIDTCHSYGIRIDFGPVDTLQEAKRLIALGADSLVTNDPARLLQAFSIVFEDQELQSYFGTL